VKLLFSEARPDYGHYIFPYAIWAFPEQGETPADLFGAGFLPSSRELDRFYLCRHLRVPLTESVMSSENRRVLRKGADIAVRLLPGDDFEFTPVRRAFCQRYSEAKFGAAAMSAERLESLFAAPVTSHVLHFSDKADGRDLGIATLYLEADRMAYYYYAFYDLAHANRSLGLFMMTEAVRLFAARGCRHLYLGTCYSEQALYKTQFAGIEFFNGVRWSADLQELKFLLHRQQDPELTQHLLEDEEYRRTFLAGDRQPLACKSRFGSRPQ